MLNLLFGCLALIAPSFLEIRSDRSEPTGPHGRGVFLSSKPMPGSETICSTMNPVESFYCADAVLHNVKEPDMPYIRFSPVLTSPPSGAN